MENKKTLFLNILKTAGILGLCTVVGYLFDLLGLRTENISMVYLVGVLFVTLVTGGFFYGLGASVASVFLCNFFFSAPSMTFYIYDANHIVTLLILLAGSFIVSALANKLQKHVKEERKRTMQVEQLYDINKKFLHISGMDNIIMHGLNGLAKVQDRKCIIYKKEDLVLGEKGNQENEGNNAAIWCYKNVKPCGYGTTYFAELLWKYIPIRSGAHVFGVVGIFYGEKAPVPEEEIVIRMVIAQIAEAMEREMLFLEQEESRLKIEKEQLRNNLLRAISHDLRTPLTSIAGSADFLIQSFDELKKDQMLSLIGGIGNDALWLNNMVENLLNMTRLSDSGFALAKQPEVVDDIAGEAYKRISKLRTDKQIHIQIPDQVMEVPMEGRLIVQVLVNLLDNALKHTPSKTEIDLNVYPEDGYMIFEVSDSGNGIDPNILDTVFDNFVTTPAQTPDAARGMGIGLGICKSIIEAHGGVIAAYNNENGGATFKFALPLS